MAEYIGNSDAKASELLRAYEEGESVDGLNEMLSQMEAGSEEDNKPDESADDERLPFADGDESEESNTGNNERKPEEEIKNEEVSPFKSFDTQENYQKHIDRIVNNRFRKNKEAEEKLTAEFDGFKNQVAELLGVKPENVLDELEKRSLTAKAEAEGLVPEQLIKDARQEREVTRLRTELAERDRQASIKRAVDDITAQGAALSKDFPGFDLDEAMENDAFRSTVFSLYNISPENAVKRAFLACEGMGVISPENESTKPKRTISEGAAKDKRSASVKKINVSELTDKEIFEIEKKIARGEKVNFE